MRRLAAAGGDLRVTIACLKLGVVKTNIRREFPKCPLLGQTPQEAAQPVLRLLLDEEFEGVTGALFLKIKTFKRVAPGDRLLDPAQGRRLWELSERLVASSLASVGTASR